MHGQLVQIDPSFLEVFLQNFSVFHQNHGFSAEKRPDMDAAQRQHRENELQTENDKDRHEAAEQGNGGILHGNGSQICDQHGHDEF